MRKIQYWSDVLRPSNTWQQMKYNAGSLLPSVGICIASDSVRREFLYSILMHLVSPATRGLIKLGSNETCSEVRIGSHCSGTLSLQNCPHLQGDLSPLLLNCVRTWNWEGRVKPGGSEICCDVSAALPTLIVFFILRGCTNAIRKSREASLVASNEIGLELNMQKIKRSLHCSSWVISRRLNFMCRRFETLHQLLSETSAHKIQTPGNHPTFKIRRKF